MGIGWKRTLIYTDGFPRPVGVGQVARTQAKLGFDMQALQRLKNRNSGNSSIFEVVI
jgi:hypothetical protein